MALPMCLQIQMAEGGQIRVCRDGCTPLLLIDFPKVPSDSWVPTVLTARLIVWAPTVQQRSSGQTGDS